MNKKKLPKAIRPDAVIVLSARSATVAPTPATVSQHDNRRTEAMTVVKRFSLCSAAAGLIPIPALDLAVVGGVQVRMLAKISQIYSVPFVISRAKALIGSLIGSTVPVSSAIGAASVLKGLPLAGTAISIIAMPAMSLGATYAIGLVFIEHFDSGGTLLDFRSSDYCEAIKDRKVQ